MTAIQRSKLSLSVWSLGLALAGALGAQTASAQEYSHCERDSGNICFKADEFYFNPGVSVVTKKGRLTMQEDGNFVLYDENGVARWSTNSQGRKGTYAVFQNDGNLVAYQGRRVVFASNTDTRGAYLVLQVDGNLVIYNEDDEPIWASNTGH